MYREVKEFWKDKKILVMGHTGFVGTWFCLTLQYLGVEVIGISLEEEENSLYARVKDNLNIRSIYEDLRNFSEIKKYILDIKPDIVFHFAAFGFIQECYADPRRAYSTNVIGTLNLLETIRNIDSVKSMVIASSDKVYKNADKNVYYFKEEDALGGTDPYSCSKTQEDLLVQSYYYSYLEQKGLSMVILRPSNIIGGGDHNMNRLIPTILDCIENDIPLEIRNPKAVRPWQYILDMVDAYLYVVECNWNNSGLKIFNVGPKKENIVTVEKVVEILLEISGRSKQKKATDSSKEKGALEQNFLGLSIEKIIKELQWEPENSIYDTLRDVWQFKMEEKNCIYKACMEQILKYRRWQ